MSLSSLRIPFAIRSMLLACIWLGSSVHPVAADPPPLNGPIVKCGAEMEYFSRIKSTGRMPPFELSNSIRNKGDKPVTDVAWPKPGLSASELKVREVLQESYPVSGYIHDKDAPIKFWYQGCEVPAEAYLRKDEKSEKGFSLRSLLRKFTEATTENAALAEIVVSLEGNVLQVDITRQPQDAQVGLTGIEPWLTSSSPGEIEASAKEYGYTSTIAPLAKILKADELDKLAKQEARWPREIAMITRRVSGDNNRLRVRLKVPQSNAQPTRATVALVGPDGSLIATGSYATFAPDR
jgi:hypothetical protein